MTPARFRWGMLLILAGALILLVNLGVLDNYDWALDLLAWFPIVLIAIGIEKIFTRSKLEAISYLTTILLVGAGFWIAFAGPSSVSDGSFFSRSSFVEEFDPDITAVDAVLEVGDADLTIRDATRDVVYGRFAEFTRKPEINYRVGADGRALVEFKDPSNDLLGSPIKVKSDHTGDWVVKFSEQVPLELTCKGRDADMHLNMATTPLRTLRLEAPDAQVYIKLGELVPSVEVSLYGDDADVKLRVPREAGLKVFGRDYDTYLEQLGLRGENGRFETIGFDTLRPQISVELDERLRSLSIDTY